MSTVNLRRLVLGLALSATIAVPTFAAAQDHHDDHRHDDQHRDDHRHDDHRDDHRWDHDRHDDSSHRQNTKNTWRNLGLAGGALGVYGLLSGNKTLAALGIGGGLYSASRYEHDRRSQSRDEHNRYDLFRRTSFDHDGHHYERRTRMVHGKKNYYFARTR